MSRELALQGSLTPCRQGRDQLVVVHHYIYCTQSRSGSRLDGAKSGRPPARCPPWTLTNPNAASRTPPATPDPACLRTQSVTGKPTRIIQICARPAASSLIITTTHIGGYRTERPSR